MKTISCTAPYGIAGLGQHLAQLVEEAREQDLLARYYASAPRPGDPAGERVEIPGWEWLIRFTPLRFSPSWTNYLSGDLFDRAVAVRLESGDIFHGFSYQSFHSLKRARHLGYRQLLLESASVHAKRVMQQQERAFRQFGLEKGWMNRALLHKTLAEYALADAIYVTTRLSQETFLEEGIPADKVRLRRLTVDPRFKSLASRPADGVFRIIYVGSLTVLKGVPVLLEAVARLPQHHLELILVGGWSSRPMRRYLQEWLRRDPRIRIVADDPLPYLHNADVYVHPSFTDGFAYAPMEALACGVPVIVTEETGMKEHVQEGINGYVVPAGSWEAILERLEQMMCSGLSRKTS